MEMKEVLSKVGFKVERAAIKNPMNGDSGFDTIYRTDTGQNMGIVSRDYQLLEHKIGIKNVLEEFRARGFKKIEPVRVDLVGGGSKMYSQFVIKDLKHDLGLPVKKESKVGDFLSPGFLVGNSYDRTMKFTLDMFIFRLVCSNGLKVRTEIFQISERHLASWDIKATVEKFAESFNRFDEVVVPMMQRLTEHNVTPNLLEQELNTVPGWVQDEAIDYLDKRKLIKIVEAEEEDGDYTIEIAERFSKYDLMNAFTYVLSHSESSTPNRRLEVLDEVSSRYLIAA